LARVSPHTGTQSPCLQRRNENLAEATKTASTAFKDAKDDARVKRDAIASKRLGELAGSNRLTIEELQALKAAVVSAKADGKVTLDEADQILIEMERIAALRSSR
jgi:hypothetical protein